MRKNKNQHHPVKTKPAKKMHIIKVFFIYLIMTGALAAWLEVSSYGDLNPFLLIIASLIITILSTYFHWKRRVHNKIDDIAEGKI
jgi:predicted permease